MALKSDVSRAARDAGMAKPVDLVHLSSMTLGDAELEREVLGLFLSHAGAYLHGVAAAVGDPERRRAGHALKGAARGIGAWQLAELAEAVESGRAGDVAVLEAELARVCDYIRSLG